MEMLTLITPTGDRPLAFALCQNWIRKQTLQPDQWIVVDDGKVPLKSYVPMEYVRREPQANDPKHTLILNLKTAMPLIKGDKIIIIEDDEYYAPEYVREMAHRLDQREVVGIMRSKYYHLPTGGYLQIRNTTHASLAETGFRSSFVPELSGIWDGDPSLDMRIWQKAGPARSLLFVDDDKPLYLGIKGLPGRMGIGAGHNPAMYRNIRDIADRAVLRQWVSQDYQVYLDILVGKLTSENYQSYFLSLSDITGITVVQDTKDLIERAYNSIRRFHPDMPIIIIDGSTPSDPCASYVKSLASDVTTVVSLGYNIGHGRGMCMGIDKAKTPFALIFDSDIEMLKSPVQAMFEMMEEDTFGVGYIEEKTAFDGFEWGWPRHNTLGEWMSYLHPFFQLIDIRNYRKFYPYVHHGAPCYLTMLDIHKQGLSDKILKQFPGLGHSSGKGLNWTGIPREHIRHDPGSTIKARTGEKPRKIEGGWVINKGLV